MGCKSSDFKWGNKWSVKAGNLIKVTIIAIKAIIAIN
jgi:hypothetical protein